MVDINQFKDFLIGLLTEARENVKRATGIARVAMDANIRLLEREIVFLSKSNSEGMDMDKAKTEIKVVDEGTFDALGSHSREKSPVTVKIIEVASKLKPGGYAEIDPKGIDPAKVTQKIHNLRGVALKEDIFPAKRLVVDGEVKEGLFLVRLTKEQMQARPKRTRKSNGE